MDTTVRALEVAVGRLEGHVGLTHDARARRELELAREAVEIAIFRTNRGIAFSQGRPDPHTVDVEAQVRRQTPKEPEA